VRQHGIGGGGGGVWGGGGSQAICEGRGDVIEPVRPSPPICTSISAAPFRYGTLHSAHRPRLGKQFQTHGGITPFRSGLAGKTDRDQKGASLAARRVGHPAVRDHRTKPLGRMMAKSARPSPFRAREANRRRRATCSHASPAECEPGRRRPSTSAPWRRLGRIETRSGHVPGRVSG